MFEKLLKRHAGQIRQANQDAFTQSFARTACKIRRDALLAIERNHQLITIKPSLALALSHATADVSRFAEELECFLQNPGSPAWQTQVDFLRMMAQDLEMHYGHIGNLLAMIDLPREAG